MRHRSNKRMPAHVRVAAFTQNLPSPGRFGDSEPNLSTDLNEASFVSCGAEGHYFGNRLCFLFCKVVYNEAQIRQTFMRCSPNVPYP